MESRVADATDASGSSIDPFDIHRLSGAIPNKQQSDMLFALYKNSEADAGNAVSHDRAATTAEDTSLPAEIAINNDHNGHGASLVLDENAENMEQAQPQQQTNIDDNSDACRASSSLQSHPDEQNESHAQSNGASMQIDDNEIAVAATDQNSLNGHTEQRVAVQSGENTEIELDANAATHCNGDTNQNNSQSNPAPQQQQQQQQQPQESLCETQFFPEPDLDADILPETEDFSHAEADEADAQPMQTMDDDKSGGEEIATGNIDKQEMDVDDDVPQPPAKAGSESPVYDVPVVRRKKLASKKVQFSNDNSNAQPTEQNQSIASCSVSDGNDQDQDTDAAQRDDVSGNGDSNGNDGDADAEDEEEDENNDNDNENDEDEIILDDELMSDELMSDVADMDIVNDSKIYTEAAPRWLVSVEEDGPEINVEEYYLQWELEKQQRGTIYSDDSDAEANGNHNNSNNNNNNNDDDNNDGSMVDGKDFFQSLMKKYSTTKSRKDPEEDKIKKDDYKLDDKFIDDGDCFEQNGVETVYGGFFIATGNVDVKRPTTTTTHSKTKSQRRSKTSTANVSLSETYQKSLEMIRNAVKTHQAAMKHIVENRSMEGITLQAQSYYKYAQKSGSDNEEKEKENGEEKKQQPQACDAQTVTAYESLLTLLLEFDAQVCHDEAATDVRNRIYEELAIMFQYDHDASSRKIKEVFEKLLDWYSFDWYDDKDDDRRRQKMNWRLQYLHTKKKRARARWNNNLNKAKARLISNRQSTATTDNSTTSSTSKPKPATKLDPFPRENIPWDDIAPIILELTVNSAEIGALNGKDMDAASHECHLQLHESLKKYVVGGGTMIQQKDIEQRYNVETDKVKQSTHDTLVGANYYYSWLTMQRIKHGKKPKHKKSKKSRRLSSNGHSSTPTKHKSVERIDLTSPSGTHRINGRPVPASVSVIGVKKKKANSRITNTASAVTRKRRHFEMSNDLDELTQNAPDELTQHLPNLDSPQSPAPMEPVAKKRRITVKNETNGSPDENGIASDSGTPYAADTLPKHPITVQPGSIIGAPLTSDLADGVQLCTIGFSSQIDQNRVLKLQKYPGTKTFEPDSAASTVPCYFVCEPYEYNTSNILSPELQSQYNLSSDTVLALCSKPDGTYDSVYRLAHVIACSDDMDNALITLKYLHLSDENEMSMPLWTPSEQKMLIPTVIKIKPLQNLNDSAHDATLPRMNNEFIECLPNNPWADSYFQGDN